MQQIPATGHTAHLPARLTFVEAGQEKRLGVALVDLLAQVSGDTVEATVTMTFENPVSSTIRGDLQLPLPEDAAVIGYAMDMNGMMVDAIPVEKEEAKAAFEREVAAGRSAGLVEDVSGNCFNLSVYPIPGSGTKTVRVRYSWQLEAGADGKALLSIPLHFEGTVKQFNLKVEVLNGSQPSLDSSASDSAISSGLSFSAHGQNSFVAETKHENAQLTRPLVMLIPLNDTQTQKVDLEQRKDVENDVDEIFFKVTDFPEVETASVEKEADSGRIGIIWDASYSRNGKPLQRELNVLSGVLKKECAEVARSVDIYLLRNVLSQPNTFSLSKGSDGAEVLKFISEQKCDGGTNTTAIAAPRVREGFSERDKGEVYSYFMLFTDGQGNIGEALPRNLSAPVFAVSDFQQVNSNFLRYVASKSGGCFYNLQVLRAHGDVIAAIGKSAFGFISAEYGEGDIEEVYPDQPQPIVPSQGKKGKFVLCGKLKAKTASITLNYGFGSNITKKVTVNLSADAIGLSAGLISRQWAQKKVEALTVFADKNKKDIHALGRNFGFVTPGTSLLILEDLATYQKYGILPPLTLPSLRAQYLEFEANKQREKETQRQNKLSQVVYMWNSRVSWWNTDFTPPEETSEDDEEEKGEEGGEEEEERRCVEREERQSNVRERMEREQCERRRCEEEVLDRRSSRSRKERKTKSKKKKRSSAREEEDMAPIQACSEIAIEADLCCTNEEVASIALDCDEAASSPAPSSSKASIQLKAWDPDTPYLSAMKANESGAYDIYLEQRNSYGQSPAFYLDCCEFFFQRGERDIGLRVLTTLLELGIDDPQLYRVVGYKLDQHAEIDQAIIIFEKVLGFRPQEPQSYRDLALVCAKAEKYQRALELLNEVVLGEWDSKFSEIEVTALVEANRIVAVANYENAKYVNPIDPQLLHPFDLDVRISMAWDTDNTDIDLHVIEPSGEEAYFAHQRTAMGGLVSRDFRQGYGPEEYMLKKARNGTYKVRARYYTSHAQALTGGTTVLLSVWTNYGRPELEEAQLITIRLQQNCDIIDVGEVAFEANKQPKKPKKSH